MRKNDVIAILISDIHLSHKPPRARRGETSWYDAMARPLRELNEIARKYKARVICAGDIFHRWDAPPELINFAIDELPHGMYCIPGQHDMPYHNPELMDQSAYNTLERAGTIRHLKNGTTEDAVDFYLHGFGWQEKLESNNGWELALNEVGTPSIAVVHQYVWMKGAGYPGALKEDLASNLKDKLEGYDVALFGDNHTTFLTQVGKCIVYNHGSFLRRTVDDKPPTIGLLRKQGKSYCVEVRILECAQKDIVDHSKEAAFEEDLGMMSDFIDSLHSSREARFDFRESVEQYIKQNRPSTHVVRILRKAISKQEKK